jgi:DNA replication protein DnaC
MVELNKSVNLTVIKSRDNELPEVLIDKYIASRFEFAFNGISIRDKDAYIDHLIKELKNVQLSDFDFGFGKGQCYIERKDSSKRINKEIEDCLIYISVFSSESYVEIYTKTIKEAEYLYNISKNFIEEDKEPRVRMHNYYHEGRLAFKELTVKSKDLGTILPEYYPDFKSTDEFFRQFTKSKENLLVLSGKPGTGKTKFSTLYLNYLMQHIEILNKEPIGDEFDDEDEDNFINIAYVKNEDILSLDSFWVNLRDYNYDIVILDDLDYFLSPRSQTISSEKSINKDKFISNFLSFTDGLIPSKTKFFITTNRTIDAIDEALKRDGRLFGVFEFSLLKRHEAYNIWVNAGLDKSSFDEEFEEDKEVLQAKLGSKISDYLANNKTKAKSFLVEGSKADISKKFLLEKRVGF